MDAYLTEYLTPDVRGHLGGFLNMADQLMLRMTCKQLFAEITRPNSSIVPDDCREDRVPKWSMEALYDAAYNDNYNVFIYLCWCQNLQIVSHEDSKKWLDIHGIPYDIKTSIASVAAVHTKSIEVWEPIWDTHATVVAVYAGRIDIVKMMINVGWSRYPAMVAALDVGDVNIIKLLHEHSQTHPVENQIVQITPEMVEKAVRRNQLEMVEWFMDFNAPFKVENFLNCIEGITLEMFKILYDVMLIDYQPTPPVDTIIHEVIIHDRVDIINWLHQTHPSDIPTTIYADASAAGAENIQRWLDEQCVIVWGLLTNEW